MPRLLRALFLPILALVAIALAASGGGTATVQADAPVRIKFREALDSSLRASGATAAACHTRARSGAGVVSKTVKVSGFGPIAARLDAARGDWDLAVFDDAGRLLAAGSGAGADEVAEGWA